ncbi:MAG: hypothetical protein AAF939_12340 [Planctomycetota bacterium]
MSLINRSLLEIKLGSYGVGQSTCLSDATLLSTVRNYKRQVASRLYPLGREDIAKKIPDSEYHVSRKIDGEFSVLVFRENEVFTLNPGGTVRVGLPIFDEAQKLLADAGVKSAVIAGELYVTHPDNRRPRVHDVVSIVRQPKNDDELSRIQFGVFDLISLDGELVQSAYNQVWEKIGNLFDEGQRIHPVETLSIKGHKEISRQFEKWVDDEDAEGLVVRSESAGSFKVKPRHTIDAVVIGFTESTGDRQGMLHDLLVGLARRDGSIHALCKVGGGFSDEDRREFLSDLQDLVVDSEYAEVNSDHVAYQMVEPKIVIEVSCLDMISQNTRGGPVNRMVLQYNRDGRQYQVVRRLPCVSVISPQFKRIRDDKAFNTTDVRISQVTDLVPVAMADADASEMTMSKCTIQQREVYTKVLKGELMVRKFIRWKTNKESDSDDFPAYVVHYTDFSPGRKTPLSREVRVSNSEEQIIELWDQLKAANIKKGWELHTGQKN